MIVIRVKGGLGNQLFQYALGYSLSQIRKEKILFDIGFTKNMTVRGYKLNLFNVKYNTLIALEKLPFKVKLIKNVYVNKLLRILRVDKMRLRDGYYYLESTEAFNKELLDPSNRCMYFDGYFQSYKYFSNFRDELLRQLTPSYKPELEYEKMLVNIKKCNSVAIHVRRGDFKADGNPYHYLLDAGYYHKCLNFMNDNINNPIYFWFSDDIEWVKQTFGIKENFEFVSLKTKHSDLDELMLMKNSKHIITANSTFSWWAAWLNENKDVVRLCPKQAYGNKDMIPDGWIRI